MPENLTIAVASGKGGTGKTTVATNLAFLLGEQGKQVQYIDCDVEEPNGNIFLKPHVTDVKKVTVDVPRVDTNKCIHCGKCGDICQYSAIVAVSDTVLTFEQLCHCCGGCRLVCPVNAIEPKPIQIGDVEFGCSDNIECVTGRLKIGDIRSPAVIRRVKEEIHQHKITILDVPPGTSCPVVEALKGADFVMLVTEPTPFGLNDLKLAVEMVRKLGLMFAVVINRCDIGDVKVHQYCERENIDIVLEIPDDRRIAEAYSRGCLITDVIPEYKSGFAELYENLTEMLEVKLSEKR